MARKINFWGFLANSLLLIAYIMSFFQIPNQAIVIIGGILIMILVVSPLFLVQSNKLAATKKWINVSVYISLFFFIPSLFWALQMEALPVIIVAVLTGSILLWFFINEFKKGRLVLNKASFFHYLILSIALIVACLPLEMQLADNSYTPPIEKPAYAKGEGSLIYIDGSHNNFHTLDNRLYSTGKLFERDGYRVLSLDETVGIEKLQECKIFLIVNALNEKNEQNWVRPIYPAFSENEIQTITKWVSEGGSLFIIADHMPFPGAIDDLATQFGFEYEDGHARDTVGNPDYFYRESGSLGENSITNGRDQNERVDSILTFSGSAIKLPIDAIPILKFDSTWVSYNPDIVWETDGVKPISINGYAQGAYKTFGKGRVVVAGEAMMFTAQLGGGLSWIKIGMNSKQSTNNYQLLLNSIHWLDGLID